MPVPSRTKKLSKTLMRAEVYADLRAWIIDGTLKPGEKLRDAELAEALGVSRMPVREAFLRLEDEGLVETSANRWTRVAHIDVWQAKRIYPLVIALEGLALSLAAHRLSEAEISKMEEANEQLSRALGEGRAVEASEADRRFHAVFVEVADNPELASMLDNLKAKLRRLEVAYFDGCMVADRSVVEHRQMLDALRDGDHARASKVLEANWRGSLERLVAGLREAETVGWPETDR
jgi:DNA-binding GntR family transcriptional regulator